MGDSRLDGGHREFGELPLAHVREIEWRDFKRRKEEVSNAGIWWLEYRLIWFTDGCIGLLPTKVDVPCCIGAVVVDIGWIRLSALGDAASASLEAAIMSEILHAMLPAALAAIVSRMQLAIVELVLVQCMSGPAPIRGFFARFCFGLGAYET